MTLIRTLMILTLVLAVGCQTARKTTPDQAPSKKMAAKKAPAEKAPAKQAPVKKADAPKKDPAIAKLPKDRQDQLSKMMREQEQIRIQQATVKAKNNLRLGKEALAKKQYSQAITFFGRVLEVIRWAPYGIDLPGAEQEAIMLTAKAKREKKAADIAAETRRREDAIRKMKEEIDRVRKLRQKRVERLFARARAAYGRHAYGEAEELAREILRTDPTNLVAKKLHEDAVEARHERARVTHRREKVERWRYFKNDMLDSRTPYADLLRFPSDEAWKRTSRRKGAGSDPDH